MFSVYDGHGGKPIYTVQILSRSYIISQCAFKQYFLTKYLPYPNEQHTLCKNDFLPETIFHSIRTHLPLLCVFKVSPFIVGFTP